MSTLMIFGRHLYHVYSYSYLSMCVSMYMHTCMSWHVEVRRQLVGVSSAVLSRVGIELRPLELAASTSTCWAMSPALWSINREPLSFAKGVTTTIFNIFSCWCILLYYDHSFIVNFTISLMSPGVHLPFASNYFNSLAHSDSCFVPGLGSHAFELCYPCYEMNTCYI